MELSTKWDRFCIMVDVLEGDEVPDEGLDEDDLEPVGESGKELEEKDA